jgi:ribosomal protein L29
METKELTNKTPAELQKLLAQYREKLRELRFKDSNKQLKNVREIRRVRENIARIFTVLNTKV